jgi:hypothetical protein
VREEGRVHKEIGEARETMIGSSKIQLLISLISL